MDDMDVDRERVVEGEGHADMAKARYWLKAAKESYVRGDYERAMVEVLIAQVHERLK